jgi:hypothetical protein
MALLPTLTEGTVVSALPASPGRSIPERVLEAELAVIGCLDAAVLHDPFWESITLHHDGADLCLAVVNLVEYEPHARSGGEFGVDLVHAVRDQIELLRQWGTACGTPGAGIVTVYRDSVDASGEPSRWAPSLAA